MPRGYCILVDGGGADNRVFDVGEKIVAPYLWRKKIRSIDLMVLSHPDSDHVNGLVFVARHFNVKQLWTNGQGVNSNACRELMDIVLEKRIDLPAFESIQRDIQIHETSLNILHPPMDFKPVKANDKDTNDHSIVLKIQHGQTAFLIPGDITRNTEKKLVDAAGARLRSQVLLSPHHGSATSSTDDFLRSVAPEFVIVSAGWRNRFGFPHPSVMERYRRYNCKVFQTAVHGGVYLVSDGKRLAVKPTFH
jgi:competence protein ComEC